MNQLWSYILTLIGVLSVYLAGKHIWWSWYIGILTEILWFIYALQTKQYGFIFAAIAYGVIYVLNAYRDTKQIIKELNK